eukprot:TRINITY_DN2787_c0_g4_i1.p4 TRINITY_DN2787_c0_g4~~TRINITY_DN2787_c0_g4_i1.p4  ORF type:complete len:117 (+),score=5.40 TRINITY_DN2787_c0_g4_i1:498-848(+)
MKEKKNKQNVKKNALSIKSFKFKNLGLKKKTKCNVNISNIYQNLFYIPIISNLNKFQEEKKQHNFEKNSLLVVRNKLSKVQICITMKIREFLKRVNDIVNNNSQNIVIFVKVENIY